MSILGIMCFCIDNTIFARCFMHTCVFIVTKVVELIYYTR